MTITLSAEMDIPELTDTKGLKVTLVNYDEGITREVPFATEMKIEGLLPGIYNVTIHGEASDAAGQYYNLGGTLVNHPILSAKEPIRVPIKGVRISPLVFKEIYYSGSRTQKGGPYFRDQYYELYNNSRHTIYLDGLYFCVLHPMKSTSKLPVWPEEDKGNYVYSDRLWRIPGGGKDYPLQPGESIVLAQFAVDHRLELYNPLSPVNTSGAEFEFNTNNPKFPDQPAPDMEHVFYDGHAAMGRLQQYLTSVFGSAYVIFRVPEGETYDPVHDASLTTPDLGNKKRKTLYAKIPIAWVLDGVEALDNEVLANQKRMPGALDAGFTTVGNTYVGRSIARKKGGEYPDGSPILVDTNNSTEDFETGLTPEIRRYGTKAPAWSSRTNHQDK